MPFDVRLQLIPSLVTTTSTVLGTL
jgi:hypothetical protein